MEGQKGSAAADDPNSGALFLRVFCLSEEQQDTFYLSTFTDVTRKRASQCGPFAERFNPIEGARVQHIILLLLCIALRCAALRPLAVPA